MHIPRMGCSPPHMQLLARNVCHFAGKSTQTKAECRVLCTKRLSVVLFEPKQLKVCFALSEVTVLLLVGEVCITCFSDVV